MDYCVPLGIPVSQLEGRPAPRPGIDPVWTDQDRELALAWTARRARNCHGCGTRPEEWAEDKNALTWSRRFCPGCQVLEQGRNQVPEHAREYVHVGLIPTALALLEEEVTDHDAAP